MANQGPQVNAPVHEFDCDDCGRHIFISLCGLKRTTCGICLMMPGWWHDPEIARRIDPDMQRKPRPDQ